MTVDVQTHYPHRTQSRTRVTLLLLALGAAIATAVAGRYGQHELAAAAARERLAEAQVVRVRPAADSTDVLPNASIALDLRFASETDGSPGIDPQSLEAGVRLIDESGAVVPAHVNTSGSGDTLVLTPRLPLRAGGTFTIETTSSLRDTHRRHVTPFRSTFSVSERAEVKAFPIAFEKVPLDADSGSVFTAITLGPDERLYAATFDGRILQYDIRPDGTLSASRTITAVIEANRGPRMIIGLAFDPTRSDRLWISHGQMKPFVGGAIQGADDWTGKISVIEGESFSQYRDAVIHLPRAYKDHLNFQPAFGPDGALYFNQGSHTSFGAPDAKWGMRPERLLTAAILRLDVSSLDAGPIDAKTEDGGRFDPFETRSPLTLYATGVRSAYDMLWHSSGRLYTSVNGAAAGGSTPVRSAGDSRLAAIDAVDQTTDDVLLEVKRGAYYGAPNPLRREYVLQGGNPTAGVDPFEVPQYPVGTMPENHWHAPVLSFGKNVSPNGMVEYAVAGPLSRAILVTRYSGGDDIVALLVDDRGGVIAEVTGIEGFTGFTDPLDLTLDARNGNLYVAEFGGQRLTLLRPKAGTSQVYHRTIR